MVLENFKVAFVALALANFASLAASQNTPNENLVLADCGIGLGENGGSTSREAIYYNGDVWTGQGENTYQPTMMVNVPWAGHYPWTQGVEFTMPNGDRFAAYVDVAVKDPGKAGVAIHSYEMDHPLSCYSYHRDRVFQLADGKWCSSAYVCNHQKGDVYKGPLDSKPEPPKPEPQQLEIIGSVNNDTVEIYNIPASRIMNTARKAFLENGAKCDTTKQQINGKCTISWKCDGDKATEALEKMAIVFDKLAVDDKFSSMREVVTDICRQPDTRPGREGQCRLWEQKVDKYYKMPSSIDLTMRNVARPELGENSNIHATLEYKIECETSAWDDFFCQSSGTILAALWPAVGVPVSIGCGLF
ncbi:hypothetical protein FLAG1_08543 [Fusarium langsethiae]|uniref:Uncharacterized protein n=1 Tax=Fusarium langsethiae TaxID=179993 RepID=A0A0M9ESC4_FUSLA|nr:hypothetical protein FLAG1_08543 [Fusarium langsethiae]GKU07400.1 unnamed protein product [Fusarium langsethiae]